MEAIFDSIGRNIYDVNGHKGYIIQWKLISPFCKKWSRNRDPDMERVNEMVSFHEKGGYIPRMIHLAEIPEEGIVCYDGNHRKEVFNNSNDIEISVVVDIMFNASQNDVYKAFNNINKSVQVPAIFIEDTGDVSNTIKTEILNLVKKYENKYKVFLSTSARCHAPHFNRDNFTDNIYNIYKSFGGVVNIQQIENLLEKLNTEYSRGRICRPHHLLKPPVVEKCRKHNMWLFLDKNIPFEHIERVHTNPS